MREERLISGGYLNKDYYFEMDIYYVKYTDCWHDENEDVTQLEFFLTPHEALERDKEIHRMAKQREDIFPGTRGAIVWNDLEVLVKSLNALNTKRIAISGG